MPLSPGDKLGPYEILFAIGAGGMGEVYKARDTRLDRTVAVKVLPEHVSQRAGDTYDIAPDGKRLAAMLAQDVGARSCPRT